MSLHTILKHIQVLNYLMTMVPNFACDITSVPAKIASVILSQH